MRNTVVAVNGAVPLQEGQCQVIAEAGANHNNSVPRAIEMVQKAAAAGAWAVKFQLYKAGSLASRRSPKYWDDNFGTTTQYEAFRLSDHLEYSDYAEVRAACRDLGIVFFATPFDADAVSSLEDMDTPIYKVASGDITHRQLLQTIAATGKPVLLSTGASTPAEISQAIEWLGSDPEKLVILACTLTYPTPDPDGNFARISRFRQEFAPFLIGMSDHTLGVAGGLMTAALGGVCIEKHYTIDKTLGDVPDHAMSVDHRELEDLVAACARGAVLRGDESIGVRESEIPARDNARRSLVAARGIGKGEVVGFFDFSAKRPGSGLVPTGVDRLVGGRALRDIEEDELVSIEDFSYPPLNDL